MVITMMLSLLQITMMRQIVTRNHDGNSSGSNSNDEDTGISKGFLEYWSNVYY